VTIDGQDVNVGGDVITAIDGTPVKTMDDVIVYLSDHADVGQKVTLTILRNGKEMSIDVKLEARAAQTTEEQQTNPNTQSRAWLGIAGLSLTPELNNEMNLSQDQTGVLIEQVQAGSPADEAGLQGSYKPVLINGQRVLIGGDVITAVDGKPISTFEDLQAFLQNTQPGQKVELTILRAGQEQNVTVTLAKHP
jgi:S1-C subfamily serine protease